VLAGKTFESTLGQFLLLRQIMQGAVGFRDGAFRLGQGVGRLAMRAFRLIDRTLQCVQLLPQFGAFAFDGLLLSAALGQFGRRLRQGADAAG